MKLHCDKCGSESVATHRGGRSSKDRVYRCQECGQIFTWPHELVGERAFGERLAELRKNAELTQVELAARVGVSQTTISRIEASEDQPSDLGVVARIARALNQRLADLVPEDDLDEFFGTGDQTFYAFCPNPLCRQNRYERAKDGNPVVYWKSWEPYPLGEFERVNFCPFCGEKLTKQCPDCTRKLPASYVRFCITCGKRICDRPTEAEWARIREKLEEAEEVNTDDEIPF